MTERACAVCIASVNGRRCKINSCKTGPYCWIHTKSIQHIQIKDSTIVNAGNGAFATKTKKQMNQDGNQIVFKRGEKIVDYKGTVMTRKSLDKKYKGKQASYAADWDVYRKDGKYRVVDAYKSNSGVGRYFNDKKTERNNNAKLMADDHHVGIYAKRNIKSGEEMFLGYGKQYWMDEDDKKKRRK